jgi:hypothetical protein
MKNEPLDKLMFMNFICLSFYVFVISSLDDHLSFFCPDWSKDLQLGAVPSEHGIVAKQKHMPTNQASKTTRKHYLTSCVCWAGTIKMRTITCKIYGRSNCA